MEIIRSLGSLKPLNGSVLTLGSYDGIHRGHREILSSVVNHARARRLPSVLITFDPHPRHVLEESCDSLQAFQAKDNGRAHVPGTLFSGKLELPAILCKECRSHAHASVFSEAACIKGRAEIMHGRLTPGVLQPLALA